MRYITHESTMECGSFAITRFQSLLLQAQASCESETVHTTRLRMHIQHLKVPKSSLAGLHCLAMTYIYATPQLG